MLQIPEEWKSARHRIIEVYIQVRSVPETAQRLGYKSPSFVRLVIHQYRDFIRQSSPLPRAMEQDKEQAIAS